MSPPDLISTVTGGTVAGLVPLINPNTKFPTSVKADEKSAMEKAVSVSLSSVGPLTGGSCVVD